MYAKGVVGIMAGGNQVGCWIFIVSREEGFFKVRKLFIVTFFFFSSFSYRTIETEDSMQFKQLEVASIL